MKIQSNGNGIKSFESEFDEDTECPTSPGDGASEHKQSEKSDDSSKGLKHSADEDFSNALSGNAPIANTPLAHQIFAPDAEVVLPQALTASQLFGIERVTGIELEAAAGIAGLSHLFLRWLGELDCFILYQYINPRNIFLMTVKYRVIIL
jgi:hypothetical protein